MFSTLSVFIVLFSWIFVQDMAVDLLGSGATSMLVMVGAFLPVLDAFSSKIRPRFKMDYHVWLLLACWFGLAIHFMHFRESIGFQEKYYFLMIYLPVAAFCVGVGVPFSFPLFRGLTIFFVAALYINLAYVAILDPDRYSIDVRLTAGGATSAGSVNYIGIAAFALAVFWYVAFRERRWLRYAAIGLPILALVMAKSRGNYIAAFCVLVVAILLRSGGWKRNFLRLALGMVSAVAVGYFGGVFTRFSDVLVTDADYKFGRLQIIYDFYSQFRQSYIWGAGIGTNLVAFRYDCHNIILELLFEGGVLLFVVYSLLFFEVLKARSYLVKTDLGTALYLVHLAVFFSNMFSGSFFIIPLFVLTYVMLVRYRNFGVVGQEHLMRVECRNVGTAPA